MLDYLLIQIRGLQARTERGASAVEYGLLVAGIAAVIVAAVFLLGTNVNDTLSDVADSIEQ
jgi:pilus assembly protein Flp/PilA